MSALEIYSKAHKIVVVVVDNDDDDKDYNNDAYDDQ